MLIFSDSLNDVHTTAIRPYQLALLITFIEFFYCVFDQVKKQQKKTLHMLLLNRELLISAGL